MAPNHLEITLAPLRQAVSARPIVTQSSGPAVSTRPTRPTLSSGHGMEAERKKKSGHSRNSARNLHDDTSLAPLPPGAS